MLKGEIEGVASFYKYQTKNGVFWRFVIDNGKDPITGKRKQTSRQGFKTKREAQEMAYELEKEIKGKGSIFQGDNKSFYDFCNMWLDIYQNQRAVKPGTIRIRKNEINNWQHYFRHISIEDITLKMFQDAINDMKKRFSESTLEGIYITGKMIFEKAVELEIIKEDPTRYSYFPRYTKTVEEIENEEKLPNYMEKNELSNFLKTCKDHGLLHDYEIFLTLAYTGLRLGELCALKTTDVFEEEGTYFLKISKTLYNPKNIIKDYKLVTTKNKTSRRTIDIAPVVYDALQNVISYNEQLKEATGEDYHDEDFIFVNSNKYPGYPHYIKFVQHRMNRILRIANMNPHLSPHAFRHTHTSLLAEAGVELERIMKRLGHANDEITKRIYLHITKPVREKDAERFSQLMDQVINIET